MGGTLADPRTHIGTWECLRLAGKVPWECEYDEYPRGRVIYDARLETSIVLADECILKNAKAMMTIKSTLHLAGNIELRRDEHYRCHHCLYGKGRK